MNPQFSIVTPCFNGRTFLPRCVGSVRGQKDVTFEHLIQDGGSNDGTVEWLNTQAGLAWQNEKDQGMYDAINKGWSRSRGEIFSWLNADEQYLPGTLARVAEAFRENPTADVVWGDTIFVDRDGGPIAARREIPLRSAYIKNGFLYALSCSCFFHRRLFQEGHLVFDNSFRLAGDADLILRLLAARRRFIQLHKYLGLFGVDGGNLSVTQSTRMNEEGALIRARHRAFGAAPLRYAVLLGRYVERVIAGCYRTEDLVYDFAVDERPAYHQIKAARVPGRFSYETALAPH